MNKSMNTIWDHWEKVSETDNRVQCLYCKSRPQLKHSIKCSAHTVKCLLTPNEVKDSLKQETHQRISGTKIKSKKIKDKISNILDELKAQNDKLLNELKFAQKHVEFLKIYRNLISSFGHKCVCNQNVLIKNSLKGLDKNYRNFLSEININDEEFVECINELNELSDNDCYDNEEYNYDSDNCEQSVNMSVNESIDQNEDLETDENSFEMRNPIWDHWEQIPDDGRRVRCLYCRSHPQLRHSVKCTKHLLNCDSTPEKVKQIFKYEYNTSVNSKKSNAKYVCPVIGCKTEFRYFSAYYKHKLTHKSSKYLFKYKCQWTGCGKLFKTSQSLLIHERHHKGEKPFLCDWPDCDATFFDSKSLNRHKNKHFNERQFACDWPGCESRFNNKKDVTAHRHIHSAKRRYVCQYTDCNKRFLHKRDVIRHQSTHKQFKFEVQYNVENADMIESLNRSEIYENNDNIYAISYEEEVESLSDEQNIDSNRGMNKSVKINASTIWKHWEKAADNSRVQCLYCKSHPQLRHAVKCRNHTFNCELTPLEVKESLLKEINASEHKPMKQSLSQKEILFILENDTIHTEFEANEPVKVFRKYDDMSGESRIIGYGCNWDDCQYVSDKRQRIKSHVMAVHLLEKPFACDKCDFRTARSSGLRKHQIVHNDERPFACNWPECDARFKQKVSLETHIMSHTGHKPYPCLWPGCEKGFTTRIKQELHQRVHSGEKPFKCSWPDCDRWFGSKGNMNLHLKIHTKGPRISKRK